MNGYHLMLFALFIVCISSIFPQRALLQILQGPPSPHIYEVALLTAPLDHMNRQNNYELVSPRIMNFSQEKAW